MMTRHGYPTFWRTGLMALLALFMTACGGGGGGSDGEQPAPPATELTASFTQQVSELEVSVDASSSTGDIASYQWDFGDGGTGVGKTSSHSYMVAGTYSVTLTVTDDKGATASQSVSVSLVAPNVAPTAAFSHSAKELVASFDASASSDSDGSIASYSWNFGDGATGSGKTSSHSYVRTGAYIVTLTVTDDKGATASQSASVIVVAPNVAPTAAYSHTAKELVASFDASASSDSDGSIASYSWNFGDGATGSGKISSHSYVRTGAYIVTLTVTDDKGATASQSVSVSVVAPNVAPTAAFTHSETDLVANFDASSSSDSDGSIASYNWNFGDGATGTGKIASHTYAAGTYSVTLTVTDDKGATASKSASVSVVAANVVPSAAFTHSEADLVASFDASSSSDSDGSIASYSWSFGDDATGTGKTASHSYAAAGTYTVTLTVTDDKAATASQSASVIVVATNVAPTAAYTHSETDLVANFDASSSSDSDGSIASYQWEFGDGATGSGKSTNHSYAAAGTYTVTLTVTDDKGATASQSVSVSVVAPNVAPTAAFTHSETDLIASFDASPSSDSDGSIASYQWEFGDGATGTGQRASHSYSAAGIYSVTLTVTDDKGTTASQSVSVSVVKANVAPSAAFTHSEADLVANFDASSSSDSDGSIASYSWNFGDGATGTGKSASHSYAVAGTYTVTLTVTDDKGATASQSASISVVAPNVAPTAAFTHSETDLIASFDASTASDSDGSIASYSWSFGDGATGTGKTAGHTYTAAGTYSVTLTVTDDKGATASQSVSVSVVAPNVAPTAAFTHSETDLIVGFDASPSSDSDGSIASYSWNFGDGTTGTGQSASHSYSAAGTYSVTLTVTDDKGDTASVTQPLLLNTAEGIHFLDSVLESKIRQALRNQYPSFTDNSPITAALLESVTLLYLNHNDGDEYIQSLDGIENLVNLYHLDLYGQHITTVAPLSNLMKLESLDLRHNLVGDVSPLSNIKKLESLYLDANPIYNLQGLGNLSSLSYLSLRDMPIYTLSPLLGSSLGSNSGTLLLGYNCLFMGDGSVPREQLLKLESEGVVLDSNDENTYFLFDRYPLAGAACINPISEDKISLAAKFDADRIVYQWSIDNSAIRADANLHCNLYYDLDQQQPRIPDQAFGCSTQGNMARQVAANGRYSGKMSLTDGFGGHAIVDLPEMIFVQATGTAHIRSVDWGQVVVSHNPKLIPNRDALLRVHVVSDEASTTVPEVSLLLTLNGQSHAIPMVKPSSISTAIDYENMDASYHAIIPASLMQPGLQAKVTLDNGESLQLTPAFSKTPTFYLTWVPMLVDGKALVPPDISDMQRALRSFWPMGELQIKQHATFTPVAKSGYELLYELTDLQTAEGDPSFFYGIYSQEVENDFAGLGWLGRPSAIGYDMDWVGGRCRNVGADYLCVMAHELGHNMGLDHVGCGTESGIPDFPYDPSGMGSLGISYDLTSLYKSSEYVDLMSYCSPQHVSDYSFNHVQDFLEANPPAPFPTTKSASRTSGQGTSSGLLLSGSLQDDGAVTVKRVIPLSRPTVVPPASELTVLARSQSQGEVTRYASILTFAEEHPENTPRYFQVELPFTDLSSLTILRDGKVVYRQSVPDAASRKKPTVPQLTEQGAEVCVQWQAGEYEGVSLMHVSDTGQRTVLTMQNPQPSACLPTDGIPDGGHWLFVTHSGLTAISHQVKR